MHPFAIIVVKLKRCRLRSVRMSMCVDFRYSFKDFAQDLLEFRSSRSAKAKEAKESREEAMSISVEEACSFLEAMG